MIGISLIYVISIMFLAISLFYFFYNDDEFLLLTISFFYLTGLSRYTAVLAKKANWVTVAYAVNFFHLTDSLALIALNMFLLGTCVLSISYIIMRNTVKTKIINGENQILFKNFIDHQRLSIVGIFGLFLLINSYTKIALIGDTNLAYGKSYFFLFSLAIGGIILLVYLLYKNLSFKYNFAIKSFFIGLLFYAAYISYNPYLRFQFISWIVALGIIAVYKYSTFKKFMIYSAAGVITLMLFLVAGNSRIYNINELSFERNVDMIKYRFDIREDQNMLDGFMMVLQVYPKRVDYQYGMEHIEILLRPIPRILWADKPVGGYANKLGLNKNMPQGVTVGISQTLYGSFYGEGGIIGIIIFSILYAYFFASAFNYSKRYQSEMRYLIKGITLASAIPLLRGGDLPGIYAFIGMSYWPVFIIIFRYNRYLKRHLTNANHHVN